MAFRMESKTKVRVSDKKISEIVMHHLNKEVIRSNEIISGFYNAIYHIETSEDEYVLKVAPSNEIDILTYEENIIKREVKVYGLLESINVPVPKVVVSDYTKSILDSDFYIMTYLQGNTLFEMRNKSISKDDIYFQLMEYLSKIHSIKMTQFGYDNFKKEVANLKEAFYLMIDNLVADALKIKLELPSYVYELIDRIKDLDTYLEYNQKPSLLHFDLWDGNIYIKDNKIVGLIDTERSLNFEPMMEFVAMHKDIFAKENKKFIDCYNNYSSEKIMLNKDTLVRYRMYQVYMYLLIVVECPYRDVKGSFEEQKKWGFHELQKLHHFFTKDI